MTRRSQVSDLRSPFALDPYQFRDLCGRFVTGVTVVTAFGPDGQPVGMTVNSFASVSLEPPLVSIAIDQQASAFAVLEHAPRWTVNILEAGQEVLSRLFSELSAGRF
ncbi:MAG TPA: flavin reductase family protein, partial [Gemmatimonadales bacterium]|nr:flavin reductase family protein [Gemmatimonadales bacterium]